MAQYENIIEKIEDQITILKKKYDEIDSNNFYIERMFHYLYWLQKTRSMINNGTWINGDSYIQNMKRNYSWIVSLRNKMIDDIINQEIYGDKEILNILFEI